MDGVPKLTQREYESLIGILRGLTAEASAHARWITTDTEKTHRRRLYRRLGASDAASAVARAFCLGVLRPAPREGVHLTCREVQVVAAIARGGGHRLAARVLDISPLTVKSHLARIMKRTSSPTAAHCVGQVFHTGMLPASWPAMVEISERAFSRGADPSSS